MERGWMILLCVAGGLIVGQAATAQELVTNGTFQTWTTGWDGTVLAIPSGEGWTVTPATEGSNYGISGVPGSPSQYQAFLAGPGPDCDSIGQTIETTANNPYTFSFWLAQPYRVNDPDHPGNFEALWNGASVLSINTADEFPWTHYTSTVWATGPSATLGFYGRADRDTTGLRGFFLTGISVVPAAVPEPGSFVLLISGLLLLAGRLRSFCCGKPMTT
jgi:hypothetical protein